MTQTKHDTINKETLRWWTTPQRGPLGWGFSPREEWFARKAMREAAKFMQGYGRGRKPRMVDKSHYEQGIQPATPTKQ